MEKNSINLTATESALVLQMHVTGYTISPEFALTSELEELTEST